jgi:hypothetical protein
VLATAALLVLLGALLGVCAGAKLAQRRGAEPPLPTPGRGPRRARRYLESSILDTVQVGGVSYREEPHLARPHLPATRCQHRAGTPFVRTDHRTGPGAMATNYAGEVCTLCGEILHEERLDDEGRGEALRASLERDLAERLPVGRPRIAGDL